MIKRRDRHQVRHLMFYILYKKESVQYNVKKVWSRFSNIQRDLRVFHISFISQQTFDEFRFYKKYSS